MTGWPRPVYAERTETHRLNVASDGMASAESGVRRGTSGRDDRSGAEWARSGLESAALPGDVQDALRSSPAEVIDLMDRRVPSWTDVAGQYGAPMSLEVQVFRQHCAMRGAGDEWRADLRTGWRVVVRVEGEDGVQIGRSSRSGSSLTDLAAVVGWNGAGSQLAGLAEDAVLRARQPSSPVATHPADRPIVLLPEAAATFVHEVFGHLLEGPERPDSIWKLAGTDQLSADLTIRSDPLETASWARMATDDEGTACVAVPLVDRGRVVGRLEGRSSGRDDRLAGAVRRASYERSARVRQTHTVVDPGPNLTADLCDGAVVVDGLVRGEVSPVSGTFACLFSHSWIGDPAGDESLGPIWLRGTASAAGQGVLAVGKEMGFGEGRCGSGPDAVPVSFASPAVLLDRRCVRTGS